MIKLSEKKLQSEVKKIEKKPCQNKYRKVRLKIKVYFFTWFLSESAIKI